MTNTQCETCKSLALTCAIENHADATGEDIYSLPLDAYDGSRTFAQAYAEMEREAAYYLESGLVDCGYCS